MINPIKMLKGKKNKVASEEIEFGQFLLWAMDNGYDIFRLGLDNVYMDKVFLEYKEYMESDIYEN